MGRYYNGDINGKFMFATQPSNAGERFYAKELESQFIPYCVRRERYDDIVKELESINKDAIKRVTKMFGSEVGYNYDIMKKYHVSEIDLREYADYQLGMKIKEFFDENPDRNDCYFEAEL